MPNDEQNGRVTSHVPKETFYASNLGASLLIFFPFASGMLYVVMQWVRNAEDKDALFVSMLIAATMILVAGIRILFKYLVSRGVDFYHFVFSTSDPEQGYQEYNKLVKSILNVPLMTVTGLMYGSLLGISPLIMKARPGEPLLLVLLMIFMFFVNYVTGVGFYGLITFFRHAIKMGRLIRVDLWQTENPSTKFLLGATRRISILASIYVCLCLSSIGFSVFPISVEVISYSVFAGLIILSSLIIPAYPVSRKIHDVKAEALLDINSQLHSEFIRTLEGMKSGSKDVDLSKFESLLQLRDKIESITTYPFRLQYLTSGLSVIGLSSIPVLLQFFLGRFPAK
ncbi:hypothetical protein ACFL45_05740 [Candidatus Neomarinimicrobiota bacterium]